MVEINGVANADSLGGGINDCVSAVVCCRYELMLNPSCVRKSHVLHGPGLLWMANLHPIGLNSVASYLIGPL